ncbi:hypothetical protein EJ110_NYTH51845 [Nymphaea thermarum]|nr:hypothetical protein EJ110_NYTH51845 [Nymphaea thermarum]
MPVHRTRLLEHVSPSSVRLLDTVNADRLGLGVGPPPGQPGPVGPPSPAPPLPSRLPLRSPSALSSPSLLFPASSPLPLLLRVGRRRGPNGSSRRAGERVGKAAGERGSRSGDSRAGPARPYAQGYNLHIITQQLQPLCRRLPAGVFFPNNRLFSSVSSSKPQRHPRVVK